MECQSFATRFAVTFNRRNMLFVIIVNTIFQYATSHKSVRYAPLSSDAREYLINIMQYTSNGVYKWCHCVPEKLKSYLVNFSRDLGIQFLPYVHTR